MKGEKSPPMRFTAFPYWERFPVYLSLTPGVIDWIEQHFSLSKLRSDYPHWDDVK